MGACMGSARREAKYRKSPKGAFMCERQIRSESARRTNKLIENLVNEEFQRNINDVYDLQNGKALGVGSFGTVRTVIHRSSGEQFALKTIETKGIKDIEQMQILINEIDLMKKLDHPSVARLQEVYHSSECIFMVMDVYSGGDLVDRERIRTEHDAATVVKDIVDGIRYCHERYIAHRDLKLENILYEHSGPDAGIKIVDFGLGISRPEASLMRDIVGTWVYMSPELLRGRHSPFAADMWSIGVITYTILSGQFPFKADSLQMLQHVIQHKDVDFQSGHWETASNECKDFVARLLAKDPEKRMTAKQAQMHPWLNPKRSRASLSFRPLAEDVTARLKTFKDQSMLKRVALEMVARTLDSKQICYLEAEFRKADKDGTGELSLRTFRLVMKESALLRDRDIDLIFKSLDVGGNGTVHFTDFMAAGLKRQELDGRRLRLAFDRLDHDNTGYISIKNLQFTVGCDLSDEQIQLAIAEFDHDQTGKIGFPEFCAGMRKCGADLDALNAATITSCSRTGMSYMVSNTTLRRLIQDVTMDIDDEQYSGASGDTEDLYEVSLFEESIHEKIARELEVEPLKRVAKSEVNIFSAKFAHETKLKNELSKDTSRNSEFSSQVIYARRATSETGKDINRSLSRKMQIPRIKLKERSISMRKGDFECLSGQQ